MEIFFGGTEDNTTGDYLIRGLLYPRQSKSLTINGSISSRFLEYVKGRGFTHKQALEVCELYGLRYCVTGDWAHRIIIPIFYDYQLVNMTGRAIGNSELRYKTMSDADASMNIKHVVWNFDNALQDGGRTLFVVEGPFDGIKLDYFARRRNCRAVALFNMDVSAQQVVAVQRLANVFDRIRIVLDNGELVNAIQAANRLSHVGADYLELPDGVADPGELNRRQIEQLIGE